MAGKYCRSEVTELYDGLGGGAGGLSDHTFCDDKAHLHRSTLTVEWLRLRQAVINERRLYDGNCSQ